MTTELFACFFTLPSRLGQRRSLVDPLGFRSTASHFLSRIAPGFTGRIRGRGWYPILAWGALQLEDVEAEQDDSETPARRVGERALRLARLERALRLGAARAGTPTDHASWRYGNSTRWWELQRNESLDHTKEAPPFFATRQAERGNNALGCLRRSMERLALFLPSEDRASTTRTAFDPGDRYRLTERGRELAEAYARDLRDLRLGRPLRDAGLLANKAVGAETLESLASALPFKENGELYTSRFRRTARVMDQLFAMNPDPLLPENAGRGPLGVLTETLRETDGDVVRAVRAPAGDDFWAERMRRAGRTASILMGPHPDGRSLFDVLGRAFVDGMNAAFPGSELDCRDFLARFGGEVAPDLSREFARRRDEYSAAFAELREWEQRAEAAPLPRAERSENVAITDFNTWLERTPGPLTLTDLVELHLRLNRFSTGRVLPLFEQDGVALHLDVSFPWSGTDGGTSASDEDIDLDDELDAAVGDPGSATGADETESQRLLPTAFWRTAYVASEIIRGDGVA